MDIWQAGGYNDGSDGVPPAVYAFPAAPGQILRFAKVAGSWTCNGGVADYGPDGIMGPCGGPQLMAPVGPFSGYITADFNGALVGMFLEETLPASAPPSLRFYDSDNSEGGIPASFFALRPRIGQVFFIGDGLTGTGTGLHRYLRCRQLPPICTSATWITVAAGERQAATLTMRAQ